MKFKNDLKKENQNSRYLCILRDRNLEVTHHGRKEDTALAERLHSRKRNRTPLSRYRIGLRDKYEAGSAVYPSIHPSQMQATPPSSSPPKFNDSTLAIAVPTALPPPPPPSTFQTIFIHPRHATRRLPISPPTPNLSLDTRLKYQCVRYRLCPEIE